MVLKVVVVAKLNPTSKAQTAVRDPFFKFVGFQGPTGVILSHCYILLLLLLLAVFRPYNLY